MAPKNSLSNIPHPYPKLGGNGHESNRTKKRKVPVSALIANYRYSRFIRSETLMP